MLHSDRNLRDCYKRSDCKQVGDDLTVNRDGFPLPVELFEANIQELKTLEIMLDLVNERTGCLPVRPVWWMGVWRMTTALPTSVPEICITLLRPINLNEFPGWNNFSTRRNLRILVLPVLWTILVQKAASKGEEVTDPRLNTRKTNIMGSCEAK